MTQENDVPATTSELPSPRVTRRAFVGLVGAGAAAVLAGSHATAATPKAAAKSPASATTTHTSPPPPDIRKGIAAQKKSLAESLEKLRAQKLPTGSWPAFGFRPMKAGRSR